MLDKERAEDINYKKLTLKSRRGRPRLRPVWAEVQVEQEVSDARHNLDVKTVDCNPNLNE